MLIDFNKWGKPEDSKETDFQAVKSLALGNIEMVLAHYLPGGKIVRGEYICGGMSGACNVGHGVSVKVLVSLFDYGVKTHGVEYCLSSLLL